MSTLERWPVPPTWEDEINAWMLVLSARGLRPQSKHRRHLHVRSLARDVVLPPRSVTSDVLLRWAGSKDWAPNTRNGYYASARGFFGFVWREDPRRDPSVVLQPVRRPVGRPRPAPTSAIRAALEGLDQRTSIMIRLMAEYGLRIGEVVLVHVRDILEDLVGSSLLVHGKGGKQRTVPLSESFTRELLEYAGKVGGGYLFPGKVNGHLSAHWAGKLVTRAMGGPWTAHTLRHRFGTTAYAATHDVLAVADLMGHANPATTRGYVRVPVDDLTSLVNSTSLWADETRTDRRRLIRLECGGLITVDYPQLKVTAAQGVTAAVSLTRPESRRLTEALTS